MLIDFHMHGGNCFRHEYPPGRATLTAHQAVDWMDRNNVDMACLLPLESPEVCQGYFLSEEVIEWRDMYPERFIAFCCFDPRMREIDKLIEKFVNDYGCKGFGEALNGLAFDDPLNVETYRICSDLGIPFVFEINTGFCWDEVGLPRLESCLKQFPDLPFVGHGPAFWSAISGDDPRAGYPEGPITPGGALDRLLDAYDNLWLDLSAGSGHNALTRDLEFAEGFVERHWNRMLWATDYFIANQPIPHMQWIRDLDVSEEVRETISSGNAKKLLKMD